jgi:transposase
MPYLNQTVGIDVAQGSFQAYFEVLDTDLQARRLGQRTFANTPTGFKSFGSWLEGLSRPELFRQVVMEATGRYHEALAYYLHERQVRLSIILPNGLKHFARSQNEFSKTDTLDAQLLARYGGLYAPRAWQPANQSMRRLRELNRERQDLIQLRVQTTNRLHAQRSGAHPAKRTIKRLEQLLTTFARQLKQIEADMVALEAKDGVLSRSLECLTSVPSIGRTTARTLLAETNGFNLFENRNQLVKYAGMDIVERQSGSSVRGLGRISKRGNGRLRSALYMCALSAVRPPDGVFRQTYQRQLDRHGCKKKALMAVQRQLLLVAFGVHQSDTLYDSDRHRGWHDPAAGDKNEVGEHQGSPTVAHPAN